MAVLWIKLAFMLIVIIIAAQLFSNALEYFSERIGMSTGVTGSIFAAISTALPETTIPIIAILAGTPNRSVNEEISVGTILGAPLMLSTLSVCVMAISALGKRGIKGRICPEHTGIKRDLNFFLMAFFLAGIAMYIPHEYHIRLCISIFLICLYLIYLLLTVKASKVLVQQGHGVAPNESLLLSKLGLNESMTTILIQLLLGLGMLFFGAKGFIKYLENVSNILGISILLLSLLIIPIATELPEKINSIIWVRKNQDTLGFSNITGSLVFQGTLLPALGILLTPWQPRRVVLTGIIITFLAALWLRFKISPKGMSILAFTLNGLLYLIYLGLTLSR